MRVLPGHDGSPASVLAAHFVGEANRSAAECFLVVDRDGVAGDFVVYVDLSLVRGVRTGPSLRHGVRLSLRVDRANSMRGEAVGNRPRFVWCAHKTPLFDLAAAAPQAQV